MRMQWNCCSRVEKGDFNYGYRINFKQQFITGGNSNGY